MQPKLELLSTKEMEQIHSTSIKILETIGVRVEDPCIRERFHDHGCIVEDDRVKIPEDTVNRVIQNKRNPAVIYGRGETVADLMGETLTHPFGAVTSIIDLKTGRLRNTTVKDLEVSTRLMDALDNVDLPCGMLIPADVHPQLQEIVMLEHCLRYTEKPTCGVGVSSGAAARYIIDILVAVAGDEQRLREKPLCTLGISPDEPLSYPKNITDAVQIIAAAGVPIKITVCPICGLTAPMSISGGLAQQNVNTLALAAMVFAINPGTPVVYSARLMFPNMRNLTTLAGLPEMGIAGACAAQLARYYGFPADVYGLSTSAHTFDVQAGYEKSLNGILPVLAGTNMLSGLGGLSNSTFASLEQLVIDNEIVRELRRIRRGFDVNKDAMGFDVIKSVIFGGGNFVANPHTVKYLRENEVFEMKAGYSGSFSNWQSDGKPSINERARVFAIEKLQDHQVTPLPGDVEKEINKIIMSAEKELC